MKKQPTTTRYLADFGTYTVQKAYSVGLAFGLSVAGDLQDDGDTLESPADNSMPTRRGEE